MAKEVQEAPCGKCGFPIMGELGDTVECPSCSTKGTITGITGITIPTPLVTLLIGLAAGILLGPAIGASSRGGQSWLTQKARTKLPS